MLDDVITELKSALDELENNPSVVKFDAVLELTSYIESKAEDLIVEYVNADGCARCKTQ